MLKSMSSLITFLARLDFSMNFLTLTKVADRIIWQKTNPTESQSFKLKFEGGKSSKLAKIACYVGYTGHDKRL